MIELCHHNLVDVTLGLGACAQLRLGRVDEAEVEVQEAVDDRVACLLRTLGGGDGTVHAHELHPRQRLDGLRDLRVVQAGAVGDLGVLGLALGDRHAARRCSCAGRATPGATAGRLPRTGSRRGRARGAGCARAAADHRRSAPGSTACRRTRHRRVCGPPGSSRDETVPRRDTRTAAVAAALYAGRTSAPASTSRSKNPTSLPASTKHDREVAAGGPPPAVDRRTQPVVLRRQVLELIEDHDRALRADELLDGHEGRIPGGDRLRAQQLVARDPGQLGAEIAELIGQHALGASKYSARLSR